MRKKNDLDLDTTMTAPFLLNEILGPLPAGPLALPSFCPGVQVSGVPAFSPPVSPLPPSLEDFCPAPLTHEEETARIGRCSVLVAIVSSGFPCCGRVEGWWRLPIALLPPAGLQDSGGKRIKVTVGAQEAFPV